jgi:hypothetical protein
VRVSSLRLPSLAQSEIVHAFLEGTTCRGLVREIGRSPPVDSNELFDIAPAEGSKSKEPQQKHKRGKKPHREARQRRGRGPRSRPGPQGPSSGPGTKESMTMRSEVLLKKRN